MNDHRSESGPKPATTRSASCSSGLWRVLSRSQGASALEFAIVAPVIVLLIAGVVELSLMFQAQSAVTHAAREGARVAIVDHWDPVYVADRAFPLTTADGLNVALTDLGDSIVVTVTYPYVPRILPLLGSVTLHGDATMRKE